MSETFDKCFKAQIFSMKNSCSRIMCSYCTREAVIQKLLSEHMFLALRLLFKSGGLWRAYGSLNAIQGRSKMLKLGRAGHL